MVRICLLGCRIGRACHSGTELVNDGVVARELMSPLVVMAHCLPRGCSSGSWGGGLGRWRLLVGTRKARCPAGLSKAVLHLRDVYVLVQYNFE